MNILTTIPVTRFAFWTCLGLAAATSGCAADEATPNVAVVDGPTATNARVNPYIDNVDTTAPTAPAAAEGRVIAIPPAGTAAPDPTLGGLFPHTAPPDTLGMFDVEQYRAEVVAAAGRQNATALPATEARSSAAVMEAARDIVSKFTGVAVTQIASHKLPCGDGDDASCAERFEMSVASENGELATSLAGAAQRLTNVAQGVHVVVWTPNVNGVAQPTLTTLAGFYRGRMLGIIVFR